MSKLVDAKGLACPQPVILTKKALDSDDDVTTLVDNSTALENVKRMASASGCSIEVSEQLSGVFAIHMRKQQAGRTENDSIPECICREEAAQAVQGPSVFVITSDAMGHGNDDLGGLLMKAFLHTVLDLEHGPDTVILYNTGVRFATVDSPALDDLKALEERGIKILVCGTCVNFFELGDRIGVGIVSNMYDIASALSTAGRIVKP
jgi:selenium metabolism protein YedF